MLVYLFIIFHLQFSQTTLSLLAGNPSGSAVYELAVGGQNMKNSDQVLKCILSPRNLQGRIVQHYHPFVRRG